MGRNYGYDPTARINHPEYIGSTYSLAKELREAREYANRLRDLVELLGDVRVPLPWDQRT